MTDELAKLNAELHEATTEACDLEQKESAARSASIAARNRLNAAQKAFDAYVEKMRKAAPRDSDWARRLQKVAQ